MLTLSRKFGLSAMLVLGVISMMLLFTNRGGFIVSDDLGMIVSISVGVISLVLSVPNFQMHCVSLTEPSGNGIRWLEDVFSNETSNAGRVKAAREVMLDISTWSLCVVSMLIILHALFIKIPAVAVVPLGFLLVIRIIDSCYIFYMAKSA